VAHWTIRLDDDAKARWQQAADLAGSSLSDFVRAAVEARIEDPPGAAPPRLSPAAAGRRTPASAAPGGRTGLCPHRRRPDQFCARCD
jgi:Family of unknown function (DUF6290)